MRKGFITNRLRSGRKSVEISIESKIDTIQGEKFVWINLQNPDRSDVEKLKGRGIEKKFLTWLTKNVETKSPRFKLAIKEEMESSKFGIF